MDIACVAGSATTTTMMATTTMATTGPTSDLDPALALVLAAVTFAAVTFTVATAIIANLGPSKSNRWGCASEAVSERLPWTRPRVSAASIVRQPGGELTFLALRVLLMARSVDDAPRQPSFTPGADPQVW